MIFFRHGTEYVNENVFGTELVCSLKKVVLNSEIIRPNAVCWVARTHGRIYKLARTRTAPSLHFIAFLLPVIIAGQFTIVRSSPRGLNFRSRPLRTSPMGDYARGPMYRWRYKKPRDCDRRCRRTENIKATF